MSLIKKLSEVNGNISVADGMLKFEDGETIDLYAELLTEEQQRMREAEVLASLREVVRSFQDGTHYESRNPYLRPFVKRALVAIK